MGRLTDQRDAQLAKLLAEGYTYAQLAKIAGITVASVKMAMRTKYPELYEQHKGARGRPREPNSTRAVEKVREQQERRRKREAEAKERHDAIKEMFFGDPTLTLDDVGKHFGISRERVRQITNREPLRCALREIEKKRRRAEANAKPPKFCPVCGVQIPPSSLTYCSPRHREIKLALRYHLDEKLRETHKKSVAKWVLKAAEAGHEMITDNAIGYAERVLDPEAELEVHGRWFTQGSRNLEYALECYENGWPLFDQLPEPLQEQVKRVYDARQEALEQ